MEDSFVTKYLEQIQKKTVQGVIWMRKVSRSQRCERQTRSKRIGPTPVLHYFHKNISWHWL